MNKEDAQLVLGALDSLGCALADHDHEWSEGERAIYEAAVELVSKVAKSKSAKEWSPCSICGEHPVHFDFVDATHNNRRCWIARPHRRSKCKRYKPGDSRAVCQIVNYESEEAARTEWSTRK